MYKQSSRLKLRFQTSIGNVSDERLWDLDKVELNKLCMDARDAHKDSGRKSFLTETSKKDKILKLKLEILVDVLTTKLEDEKNQLSSIEVKKHNDEITQDILAARRRNRRKMSEAELQKLYK